MHARLTSVLVLLAFLAAPMAAADDIVTVKLDFGVAGQTVEAADGASMCQYEDADKWKTIASYSGLTGFPDRDGPDTGFGRFCDTCFSAKGAKGMALSQLWSTPTAFQAMQEKGYPTNYTQEGWDRNNMAIYEPTGAVGGKPGHQMAFYRAALRRARAENLRMLMWFDVHHRYPPWMTTPDSPLVLLQDRQDQAACFLVYYARYLVSRHGIPLHALSVANEYDVGGVAPDAIDPPQGTGNATFAKLVRAKLDQADLHGVRIVPGTLGNRDATILDRQAKWIEARPEYAAVSDYISHHSFRSFVGLPKAPLAGSPGIWYSSGSYGSDGSTDLQGRKGDGRWFADANGYLMGPDSNTDETVRLRTYMIVSGHGSLIGTWQLANRVGAHGKGFNTGATGDYRPTSRQIDGGATVNPYLRPGMYAVGGSQGRHPREPYSVDGFSGRGHRELIVITNSQQERRFKVVLAGVNIEGLDHYQCESGRDKRLVGRLTPSDGAIVVTVPADSVSALVATVPHTKPRVYLVVKDAACLADREIAWSKALNDAGLDAQIVPASLAPDLWPRLQGKRHPVDPMGAAAYILSDTVDAVEVGAAHATAMAPVIVVGGKLLRPLGLEPNATVLAGEPLSFRRECDPPERLLAGGKPLAPGWRRSLPADVAPHALLKAVTESLPRGGRGW